jgi:hypothetical protein
MTGEIDPYVEWTTWAQLASGRRFPVALERESDILGLANPCMGSFVGRRLSRQPRKTAAARKFGASSKSRDVQPG